jgi:hypothetical protein
MTNREKLIELLAEPCRKRTHCSEDCCKRNRDHCKSDFADHLLANGVTFATGTNDGGKWTSVGDSLPNTDSPVLVWIADKEEPKPIGFGFASFQEQRATDIDGNILTPQGMFLVTHWMPMPEPPKEE